MDENKKVENIFPLLSMGKLESILKLDRTYLWKIANKAGNYYNSFDQRPSGSKKKWRHIDNPIGDVREIQKRLQKRILNKFLFPSTMLGGVKKGSIIKNAKQHANQKFVFAIDIRNCFPSIKNEYVLNIFREHLGCSAKISYLLTKLTTYQTRLPQGAQTSTFLANLSLLNLHDEIGKISNRYGLKFTFYVDDIVISGEEVPIAIEPIIKTVQRLGFSIANKKKNLMRGNSLQKVTGLIVNKKVNISKEYVETLRKEIITASKKGYFTVNEKRSFEGKIRYIQTVNEKIGKRVNYFFLKFQLPSYGSNKKYKFETRPCKCARRHIEKRAS